MVKLERLRQLRERRALSQAELAERAGITRTALSRIESCAVDPHAATVRRLAAALGVEPEALMAPISQSKQAE